MPIVPGEGPIGLIICPSRELARQTEQVLKAYADAMSSIPGWPRLKSACLIGGLDQREQMDAVRDGVHCVVATPGRLIDFLGKKVCACPFGVLKGEGFTSGEATKRAAQRHDSRPGTIMRTLPQRGGGGAGSACSMTPH